MENENKPATTEGGNNINLGNYTELENTNKKFAPEYIADFQKEFEARPEPVEEKPEGESDKKIIKNVIEYQNKDKEWYNLPLDLYWMIPQMNVPIRIANNADQQLAQYKAKLIAKCEKAKNPATYDGLNKAIELI